jgi:hypothetical protein
MKLALLVCLTLFVAQPARAQSRVYLSGDLFAEITRMSRTTVTPDDTGLSNAAPLDAVTAGGGIRAGAFFSQDWSLELGLDLGKTVGDVRTQSIRVATGLSVFPTPQFQARTSSRFSAASVLAGYHPPARGRVRAGFRGGISLMHTERIATNAIISGLYVITTTPGIPFPVPILSVNTTELKSIGNGVTATLAAEAAIEASRHFAVIPEMRVHAGGLGGFVLRPGVAARWLF